MPIGCRVTRGNSTESIHIAFAVAVDSTGIPFFSTGDPQYLTCVRSSLKPFQAAASVREGAVKAAQFENKELALMCASHSGEKIHQDIVNQMLNKLNLDDCDLECGSHYPGDKTTKNQLIENKIKPRAIHNNCSGKHAGMLALAKHLGSPIKNYIDKKHIVQKTIMRYIESITGLDNIATEIDGCSVPTPFLTLQTIATMFQMLASGKKPELGQVYNAMSLFPEMIGGSNHFDSLFIDSLKGRGVTKVGGESVRGISIKTKNHGPIGIAIKILDGNFRAMPIITMTLLEHLELLMKDELRKLDKFRNNILTNHNGIEYGRMEAYIDF